MLLQIDLNNLLIYEIDRINLVVDSISPKNFNFVNKVWIFTSSDTILNLGESYAAHFDFCRFDVNESEDQKIGNISLFKNGISLDESNWDTTRMFSSINEVLFTPKNIGVYKWEVEHLTLSENGIEHRDTIHSQFIVKHKTDNSK
jgi:hypothetical protein